MKGILVIAAVLGALAPVATAQAAPVQGFSFQLKDVKPDGRFTVLFGLQADDTSGAVPPVLTENFVRLPAGVKLRREFRNKRYSCDGPKLHATLIRTFGGFSVPAQSLENLDVLIRRLGNDRRAREAVKVCKRAQVGRGRMLLDHALFGRVPFDLYFYLSKADRNSATASLSMLTLPDESSPIVMNNVLLRGGLGGQWLPLFDQPTPDGRYGYKLQLPPGNVEAPGHPRTSLAKLEAVLKGLALRKRETKCLKRKRGRCVKRTLKEVRVFWLSKPRCPPSRKLSAEAFFGYDSGVTATEGVRLPCPRASS